MSSIIKILCFSTASILFISLSHNVHSQVNHWESIIVPGDEFHYLLPEVEPADNWQQLNFDDNTWSVGDSGFGYGDNDDQTIIPATNSVYLRKTFTIFDLAAIDELLFHMDHDDGFVAYLNGQEFARALLSGSPPTYDQLSDDLHEAQLYQGRLPSHFNIDLALLNEGENILAIQVHNQAINSSDLTAIPVLSVGINNTSENYSVVPEWFRSPINFTSSNLPIVFLNTEGGQEIPDEPKIWADMQIIYRGAGERTFVKDQEEDQYINFKSKIKIEIRGSSSQALPKKQYGFTTYDPTGTDKDNVELLGMPKENDWILNGLAFDPSLMRDYISYNLSRRIGEYASRTQYCEMVLNGPYNGLYILQEKMKKDKNRINITAVGDNEDGNITGGYITKSDKIDESDPIAWSMPNYLDGLTNFVHVEPKPEEVTNAQNNYIQKEFERLQSTIDNSNTSKVDGYPSVIDIPSFLNFIILNELASNVDAYEFSTYFHKDKNGKLRAGPLWDFNLTYGNDLFIYDFDRSFTDVWQFDDDGNIGARFWRDLFQDDDFNCYLRKRWGALTADGEPLSLANVLSFIETTDALIEEATVREQQRWGTVSDHSENITNMKLWITERMQWMDDQLGSFASCTGVETPALVISKINYHPFSEVFGDISKQEFIEISNIGSTGIDLSGIYFGGTGFVYQFPANSSLDAGASLGLANDQETFQNLYGTRAFGEFTRSLSNDSQRLLLLDAFGNIIDEVTYDDNAPWPEAADGNGSYLQLTDLKADNTNPNNWSASKEVIKWSVLSTNPLKAKKVIMYPNPSRGIITIESQAELINSLRLIDLQGKELKYLQLFDYNYTMDLSKYQNGIYLLQINMGKELQSFTVLKHD